MDPMFLTSGHTHEGCSELSGGSTMAVCCFAGLHACYVSSTVGESFSVSVRHIWLAVCLLVLPGRTASQIELSSHACSSAEDWLWKQTFDDQIERDYNALATVRHQCLGRKGYLAQPNGERVKAESRKQAKGSNTNHFCRELWRLQSNVVTMPTECITSVSQNNIVYNLCIT